MVLDDVAIPWKGVQGCDHDVKEDLKVVASAEKWTEDEEEEEGGRDGVEEVAAGDCIS